MKYSTIDTSLLDLENADVANIVNSRINEATNNRDERRRVMKALRKVENREKYFNARQSRETKMLREAYQKEVDQRAEEMKEQVLQYGIDDWLKSIALAALVLKRSYNWNNNKVSKFVEKTNELHLELLDNGEWNNIMQMLDEECDIQFEIGE